METIEHLRKVAKSNLCDRCFKEYKIIIEPSIEDLLFKPIDDWRKVESDITQMVMKTKGVFKGKTIFLSLDEGSYLFSWDKIPVRDNGRLIKFLKQNYSIDWVKIAKIEKIEGGRTIKLSTGKNYLSLRLNDEKTKVSLKIDDGRTDEFIVKMENRDINIYENSKPQYWNGEELAVHVEVKDFQNIMFYWGFTRKIDYLLKHKILQDCSHRLLDKANEVRNKIHDPYAPFSEQDLYLFHIASMVTNMIWNATMGDWGEDISTNFKSNAEKVAKQCLLELNYE